MKPRFSPLRLIVNVIGFALLSYAIARLISPSASLLGALLAPGPLIVLCVIMGVWAFVTGLRAAAPTPSTVFSQRVAPWSRDLPVSVVVYTFDDPHDSSIVHMVYPRICVNVANWQDLGLPARDFLLARGVAEIEHFLGIRQRGRAVMGSAIVVGGVLGSLNLWVLLAIYTIGGFFLARWERGYWERVLACDRRALDLTMDFEAAIEGIRADHASRPFPRSVEDRIAALESNPFPKARR